MSSLVFAVPGQLTAASEALTGIGSAVRAANTTAASSTTQVVAAAQDEVSTTISKLFAAYGQEFQALSAQAASFHDRFVQSITAATDTYAAAESVNAAALQTLEQDVVGAIGGPADSVTGHTLSVLSSLTASTPASNLTTQALVSPAQTSITAVGGDVAIIMGPSGFPVPPSRYVDAAMNQYIQKFFPGAVAQPLTTPEGLYPFTGVNTLPLDSSVTQGVATLDNAIMQQINAGKHPVVFGYSQSSIISSLEMSQLAANHVSSGDVSFILVGDPVNPDGGFISRFDVPYPLGGTPSFPYFGLTLSGGTPSDFYPTQIFTKEYDGFADFPRYPINFISDVNAYLGIVYDHATYLNPTPGSQTINLGTYGMTTYYMITDPSLPLLDPLRIIPVVGQPIYDLFEPDTRILVNLGYGSIYDGWDTQNAPNVTTPFGLFPTNIDPGQLIIALANGAQQGVSAAIQDLLHPSFGFNWSSLQEVLGAAYTFGLTPTYITNPLSPPSNLLELINAISTFGHGDIPVQSNNILDAFGSAVSTDSATVLPAIDTALTAAISLPQYNANVFLDGIQSGDLLAAVGDPIAADVALAPFLIGAGTVVPILEAAAINVSQFASVLP